MKPLTALTALVLVFVAPVTASASLPDLCDDVFLDPASGAPLHDLNGFMLSRFCEWIAEDAAPVWADNVCCTVGTATATCTPTTAVGRCTAGIKMWCDYAAVDDNGKVTCYQPWADACDGGFCSVASPGTTLRDTEPLCCQGEDDCTVVNMNVVVPCGGFYVMCESPFTNSDGSIGCADNE
jgi:hypothetical protein